MGKAQVWTAVVGMVGALVLAWGLLMGYTQASQGPMVEGLASGKPTDFVTWQAITPAIPSAPGARVWLSGAEDLVALRAAGVLSRAVEQQNAPVGLWGAVPRARCGRHQVGLHWDDRAGSTGHFLIEWTGSGHWRVVSGGIEGVRAAAYPQGYGVWFDASGALVGAPTGCAS